MDKQQLKQAVMTAIDARREDILSISHEIYKHPETGYREFKTTELLADTLEKEGYEVERGIAYTGCRGRAAGAKAGPKIAVMGELDSVLCPTHPDCDAATGAMHACGHHLQTTVMAAVAIGLKPVLDQLGGSVDFIAIPAEECIELGYRDELKRTGKITYLSGKQEYTYKGGFDDVDIAAMIHSFDLDAMGKKVAATNTGTGFINKSTRFIGKEAHAGGAPWDGINALNMADIAIAAINTQRETFKDTDRVRIHQIITKGGDLLNAVPADVRMDTTIRAMNVPAMKDACAKFDRCVHGAAIALGGHAEISDTPGYLPMFPDATLAETFTENAKLFYAPEQISPQLESTASFDIGDLSHFMPILHAMTSGVSGGLHSREFQITNEDDAVIIPAKIVACTIIDLLADDAALAKKVVDEFQPRMTKEEYLAYLKEMTVEKSY